MDRSGNRRRSLVISSDSLDRFLDDKNSRNTDQQEIKDPETYKILCEYMYDFDPHIIREFQDAPLKLSTFVDMADMYQTNDAAYVHPYVGAYVNVPSMKSKLDPVIALNFMPYEHSGVLLVQEINFDSLAVWKRWEESGGTWENVSGKKPSVLQEGVRYAEYRLDQSKHLRGAAYLELSSLKMITRNAYESRFYSEKSKKKGKIILYFHLNLMIKINKKIYMMIRYFLRRWNYFLAKKLKVSYLIYYVK